MKITDVEAIALVWPAPDREYWTALRPIGRVSELLVRVHTDAGYYGIGEAHGAGQGFAGIYRQDSDGAIHADGASRAVVDLLKPMLLGRDPVDHEQLWDEMFGLCHQIGWAAAGFGRPQILTALAAVDIALWDIKGKAADMPVYKLLGGTPTPRRAMSPAGTTRMEKRFTIWYGSVSPTSKWVTRPSS